MADMERYDEFANTLETRMLLREMQSNQSLFSADNKTFESAKETSRFAYVFELAAHLRDRQIEVFDTKPFISQGRQAKIAIGVPSVKREEVYLFKTLNSLVRSCSRDELKQILIIVFIAEVFLKLINAYTFLLLNFHPTP